MVGRNSTLEGGEGRRLEGKEARRRRRRVSSSTEPIQTRNLSYQFLLGGVAKSSPVRPAILTLYRILPATKSAARASRGSPSPTAPTIISLSSTLPPPPLLSPSFDRDFLVFLLSECTRITWPNTLPAEFLQRPSFHRVEYLFGRLIALVPSPYPVAGRVDRRSRDYDTIDLEGEGG